MTRNHPFLFTTFVVLFSLSNHSLCFAATVAQFDFDGPEGFSLVPDVVHGAVLGSDFSAQQGSLTDFAGVTGRALGASQFLAGNRIDLELELAGDASISLESLNLALRRSSTGPTTWHIEVNSLPVGNGTVGTSFDTFAVPLALNFNASRIDIAIIGSNAASNAGTLRIDDLTISGTIHTVPLPTAGWLMLSAILPSVRCRRYGSSEKGHSRHASTTGKYSPSMIGRSSVKRMTRA